MKATKRILIAAGIMVAFTTAVTAQNGTSKPAQSAAPSTQVNKGVFTDKNNNGVCDNYEARQKTGKGANYADKNGDGICDNRPAMKQGQGKGCFNGTGFQRRHGNGQGNCCGRGPCGKQGRGNSRMNSN